MMTSKAILDLIRKKQEDFSPTQRRVADYVLRNPESIPFLTITQFSKNTGVSSNTIDSYRDSLNNFIDYLEQVEQINWKKITLNSFERETLKRYQEWMITGKKLAPKTCNLRMTAIRAFLEYAAQEYLWVMPIYTDACTIVGVKTENHAFEYFEPNEMTALLAAPSGNKKTDRRNQMILVFLYDTAARVS